MKSLIASLEQFNCYFTGIADNKKYKLADLQNYMKYYETHPEDLQNFYKITITNSLIIKDIQKILINLNIYNEWEKLKVKNPNVYDFFLLLTQKNFSQAEDIIDVIDEKNGHRKLAFILGGTVLAIGSGLLVLIPATLHIILEMTKEFFSWLYAAPLVGLVFGFFSGIFQLYSISINQKMRLGDRFRDIFFQALATAIKITASILLLATGAIINPGIASIFIFGAALEGIKEIVSLIQEKRRYISSHSSFEVGDLIAQQANARRDFGYRKRIGEIGINIASSIILTTIIAIWAFNPIGGIMTIFALLMMGLVSICKYAALKYNESLSRELLQDRLCELNYQHVPPNHPPVSPKPHLTPSSNNSSEPPLTTINFRKFDTNNNRYLFYQPSASTDPAPTLNPNFT